MKQEISYSFWQLFRDLIKAINPYKRTFWLGVFFRATSDIANLYPAWAISQIVLLLTRPQSDSLNTLIYIFVGWIVVTIYFSFAHSYARYLGFQVAEQTGLDLYRRCLKHIVKLDLSWQEKENSGNKMKRLEKGFDGMNQLIRRIFDVLIEVIVNTVGIVIIFATLQPTISYALLFFIVTYFILGNYLLKKAVKQEILVNRKGEDLGGITFEALNNMHTIKALAINKGIIKTIEQHIRNLIAEIKKRIFYFQTRDGILNFYEGAFGLAIVGVLVWSVLQHHAEISLLVLFLGLFQKVAESTRELTGVTQDIVVAKIWISRTVQIMQVKPGIENDETTQVSYPADWKELRIQKVHFGYGKNAALNDVELTIKRGESIGIVGLSGSGKSTLFKLLLDLYENYEGDISLDANSFKKMNRQSYIDNVAVVLQDTELFNLSLKENITIAATGIKQNPTLDEVIRMAHLQDVVDKLPQGLSTLVGEKGIKLSGGQRQRVGIARALFRQPDILLMDEATSHLDAYSEKQIQQALQESMHRFTTIIIAHRLATIKKMDKIVVLHKGRVEEYGTFQELIAKKGTFATMWQEQKL